MFLAFNLAVLAVASEGGGSLIDVNPGLIFWTVVTFLILFFILKKTAWKPILSALEEREAAIRESLEKAEKAKEEANLILQQNKANLAAAGEEAKKIVDQSRAYADKVKEQIIQESKEQAQKIITDASAEIERKKEAAFDELKVHVAEIAVNAAEKILKETLDKESNKKLVNTYINEIAKN
jgi:F-type H+-transporting ATPase subunit b